MLGELNQEQIDHVLRTEVLGRIGCHAENRTYIVPINYVYDGESIYAHSLQGMKLRMMHENPEVCFEVDHVENLANWQSVIAWGTFEELDGEEAARAVKLLVQRMMTLVASGQDVHELVETEQHLPERLRQIASVYRIRLSEKTGRFETNGGRV